MQPHLLDFGHDDRWCWMAWLLSNGLLVSVETQEDRSYGCFLSKFQDRASALAVDPQGRWTVLQDGPENSVVCWKGQGGKEESSEPLEETSAYEVFPAAWPRLLSMRFRSRTRPQWWVLPMPGGNILLKPRRQWPPQFSETRLGGYVWAGRSNGRPERFWMCRGRSEPSETILPDPLYPQEDGAMEDYRGRLWSIKIDEAPQRTQLATRFKA